MKFDKKYSYRVTRKVVEVRPHTKRLGSYGVPSYVFCMCKVHVRQTYIALGGCNKADDRSLVIHNFEDLKTNNNNLDL